MTKLLWELSKEGRCGVKLPAPDVPASNVDILPSNMVRTSDNGLPQLSELQVVRHFVELSNKNHHVDKGFYPLGSCTMKYNPKINERTCTMPGFLAAHPLAPDKYAAGAIELMRELGDLLCKIAGMDAITLQPSAGAHGEFCGLLAIRKYHESLGKPRKKVLIPDSSHGTNPASIVFSGWEPVEIKSGPDGRIDLAALEVHLNEDLAAMMITNPNTLGLFENDIALIAEKLHSVGAQLYMDGANMNALLGIARPGDFGVDAMHYNLHKTFSTPHGGGGPGSGPVAVKSHLAPFLPKPTILSSPNGAILDYGESTEWGKLSAFHGAFGVMVRALTYILIMGRDGLRRAGEDALLNSNYLCSLLSDSYDLPYKSTPMHEFVLSGEFLKKYGIKTADIAKRLLDFGYHAPTIYFPLIVHEAIMIEPTETEDKGTLDAFAEAMLAILDEARTKPDVLHEAPTTTPVRRLDEVGATKTAVVTWWDAQNC